MYFRKPTKVISAAPLNSLEYLKALVQYRHLIWVFAQQEFKMQYVQTRLNLFWVVLRPLMVLALFTFIFGQLIKIPNLHYPYSLFAFTGLLVWNNFSFLVNNGGNVVINNQHIIRKMYFPRVVLILSKLLMSMVELAISLVLIILLMLALRYPITPKILLVPFFLAISIMAGLSVALWLNSLSIKYRDVHQFVPTLIGFMIWLTPVFYPVTLVPRAYSFILFLNPISAAIQGCRWAILGDSLPSIYYLPSVIASGVIFIVGFMIFVRADSDLTDYI